MLFATPLTDFPLAFTDPRLKVATPNGKLPQFWAGDNVSTGEALNLFVVNTQQSRNTRVLFRGHAALPQAGSRPV